MCEWCDRLVLRNWKWDRHAYPPNWNFMINYTMKSQWHKDWHVRKDWRRALSWCEDNSLHYEDIGRRCWKHANGVGSRYYDRK